MYLYFMVYLDDVIIFSDTVAVHGVHLVKVLVLLSRHGLKSKFSKCELAKTRVRYFRRILDGWYSRRSCKGDGCVCDAFSQESGGIAIVFRYGWLLSSFHSWFCKNC